MSALRYCGTLKIQITLISEFHPSKRYRVRITATDVEPSDECTVYVRLSDIPLKKGADVLNAVAHRAIDVAAYRDWPVQAHARSNRDGSWEIRREE